MPMQLLVTGIVTHNDIQAPGLPKARTGYSDPPMCLAMLEVPGAGSQRRCPQSRTTCS